MTKGKPAKPDASLGRPIRGHHGLMMGKHHGHVDHMKKHAAHAELVKRAAAAKKHLEQVQLAGADKNVGDLTHDVSERAAYYAAAARDWTAPRVEAAIDWASPRAQDAYRRTMRAAAPKVKVAADRIEPLVDTAHDKIVDEILPGIVESVAAAAAGAGYAAEEASRRTKDAAKVIKGEAVAVPVKKKKHVFRKVVLWVGITAAVAAVGYAAYQRLRPLDDPWAEEDWASDEDESVLSSTATSLKDAAAAAKESATSATDAAVSAAKDAAKKTTSAAKKAADEA